jgi:hypothetical protein
LMDPAGGVREPVCCLHERECRTGDQIAGLRKAPQPILTFIGE